MSACISGYGEYSNHTPDAEHVCAFCGVLDEDALRAELAEARANIEKLIIRNNELTRERGDAIRKARRPVDALNIPALCGRLSIAADDIERVRRWSVNADDRSRLAHAIEVITDTVRALYAAGEA